MTILFKSTSSGDVNVIQKLAAESWPPAFEHILTPEQIRYMMDWMYNTAQLQQEIEQEHIHYDQIFCDDSCCGFVAYGPGANPEDCKLHKLYLLPAFQRRGIGQAAMSRVADYAGTAQARFVILRVNRHNSRAINAYLKRGFRIRKEDVADIGNGYVMDDYIMELPLEEEPATGSDHL